MLTSQNNWTRAALRTQLLLGCDLTIDPTVNDGVGSLSLLDTSTRGATFEFRGRLRVGGMTRYSARYL